MCELYVKADPILYESRSRSLRIRGVVTTLRLENQFWDILREIAATIPAYAEARVERRPFVSWTRSRTKRWWWSSTPRSRRPSGSEAEISRHISIR